MASTAKSVCPVWIHWVTHQGVAPTRPAYISTLLSGGRYSCRRCFFFCLLLFFAVLSYVRGSVLTHAVIRQWHRCTNGASRAVSTHLAALSLTRRACDGRCSCASSRHQHFYECRDAANYRPTPTRAFGSFQFSNSAATFFRSRSAFCRHCLPVS